MLSAEQLLVFRARAVTDCSGIILNSNGIWCECSSAYHTASQLSKRTKCVARSREGCRRGGLFWVKQEIISDEIKFEAGGKAL